jgi:hypothetical protein
MKSIKINVNDIAFPVREDGNLSEFFLPVEWYRKGELEI